MSIPALVAAVGLLLCACGGSEPEATSAAVEQLPWPKPIPVYPHVVKFEAQNDSAITFTTQDSSDELLHWYTEAIRARGEVLIKRNISQGAFMLHLSLRERGDDSLV